MYKIVHNNAPGMSDKRRIVLIGYLTSLLESCGEPKELLRTLRGYTKRKGGLSSVYAVFLSTKEHLGTQLAYQCYTCGNPKAADDGYMKELMRKDALFLSQYPGEPDDTLLQRYKDYILVERSDNFLAWVDDEGNAVVRPTWMEEEVP